MVVSQGQRLMASLINTLTLISLLNCLVLFILIFVDKGFPNKDFQFFFDIAYLLPIGFFYFTLQFDFWWKGIFNSAECDEVFVKRKMNLFFLSLFAAVLFIWTMFGCLIFQLWRK